MPTNLARVCGTVIVPSMASTTARSTAFEVTCDTDNRCRTNGLRVAHSLATFEGAIVCRCPSGEASGCRSAACRYRNACKI